MRLVCLPGIHFLKSTLTEHHVLLITSQKPLISLKVALYDMMYGEAK